jgi:HEAT repeats
VATIVFLVVVAVAAVVSGVIVLWRARETVAPVAADAPASSPAPECDPPAPQCHAELVEAWPEEGVGDHVLRQAQHDNTDTLHDTGVRWSQRFDPPSGTLSDDARLALIRDLAFVRGGWCVPLLAQAYEEERSVEHRRAALTALAAYRHPDARPTLEAALTSEDEQQRAIAAAALDAIAETRRT